MREKVSFFIFRRWRRQKKIKFLHLDILTHPCDTISFNKRETDDAIFINVDLFLPLDCAHEMIFYLIFIYLVKVENNFNRTSQLSLYFIIYIM